MADSRSDTENDPHRDDFTGAEIVARTSSREPFWRDLTTVGAFLGALAMMVFLYSTAPESGIIAWVFFSLVSAIIGGLAWFFSPLPNHI